MLEKVKEYLRGSGADDGQIEDLIEAADIYLVNAGTVKDYGNALYVLALKILATHWYENRVPIGEVTKEMSFSLSNILIQLKYCYGGDEE